MGTFPYGIAQGEGRSHLRRWQEEAILSLPRGRGKWLPVEKSQGLSQSTVKCLQAPSFHKELSAEVPGKGRGQGPWIRRPGMKAPGLARQTLGRAQTLTPSRLHIQAGSGRAAPPTRPTR